MVKYSSGPISIDPHSNELRVIIWQIISSIPEGYVASYGQIARLSGYPNHARYVGRTLKSLPPDTKLPWHRVVNAKGDIAFPVGSDAAQLQRQRLEAEKIAFSASGRVLLAEHGWQA